MEKSSVCSEGCEKAVIETCKSIEKGIPLFLAAATLGSIMGICGIFVSLMREKVLAISAIGIFILGITFIIFPFVAPQTVKIFGLRKGMILGRISGLILLLLGFLVFKALK